MSTIVRIRVYRAGRTEAIDEGDHAMVQALVEALLSLAALVALGRDVLAQEAHDAGVQQHTCLWCVGQGETPQEYMGRLLNYTGGDSKAIRGETSKSGPPNTLLCHWRFWSKNRGLLYSTRE